MINHCQQLLQPTKVWSRAEVLTTTPSPVPDKKGAYAWYFREFPAIIPRHNCITFQGLTLLYVGIAPAEPPENGKPPSEKTLYDRIRYHYGYSNSANASRSTLRRSLGCLLADELGIRLQWVKNRITYADGEAVLSEWMERNAFVVWTEHERPWELEKRLIAGVSLPLNLKHNTGHPFYATLKAARAKAKDEA